MCYYLGIHSAISHVMRGVDRSTYCIQKHSPYGDYKENSRFKIRVQDSKFRIQDSKFKIQNSKLKNLFFPSLTFTSIIPFVYLPPQTPSSVPPRALGVQQLKLPTTWTAYNESIPHHFSLALSSFVPIHPVSRIEKAVNPLMLI